LVFKRCETPIEIICSVDASFATGPKKKSITGWSIYVGGSLVYWRTKTQPITAQSSAEAELIAITDAVKNGLWLKRLLQELNLPVKKESVIECDNLPAIQLLQGSRRKEMVKHLEVRYFFVVELIQSQEVILILKSVDTGEQ
jgi:hypothetical protein